MGVPEGLPEEVHVGRFLESRIKEIAGKILFKNSVFYAWIKCTKP
jgi:hypothetical protein